MINYIIKDKLYFLLIITAIVNLFLFIFPIPIIQDDSFLYIDLADKLWRFDLNVFEGGKPPLYSLFLIMAFINVRVIILYQLIIGFFNVLLIFRITRFLTNISYMPFLTGFIYAIYLPALRAEIAVLSETLATFLVSLSIFFLLQFYSGKNPNLKLTILFSSLAGLTRPEYIILPFFIIGFLFFIQIKKGLPFIISLRKLIIIILFPTLLFLVWCSIVYHLTGEFFFTTGRSFEIMEILGDSVLDASDTAEFSMLKKEYLIAKENLLTRKEDVKEAMSVAASIVREKLGLSLKETEALVFSMAIETIKKRPMDYLEKVINNWKIFWLPETIKMADPEKTYFKNYMTNSIANYLRKGIRIISCIEYFFI